MSDKRALSARDLEAFDGLSWIPLHLMFEENCKPDDVEVHILPTGFLEARILATDATHFYESGEWRYAKS